MSIAVLYRKADGKSAELALLCDESEDELAFNDTDLLISGFA